MAFVASTHPDAAMVVPVSHPLPQAHRHVFLARSDDGGRSFSTTMVHEAEAQDSNLRLNKGPMLAVDPSDSSQVYVGWRQGDIRTDGKLKTLVAASDDGGDIVEEPVDISQEAGGDYPALAVTTDGTLHAVFWERDAGVEEGTPRLRRGLIGRRLCSCGAGVLFGFRSGRPAVRWCPAGRGRVWRGSRRVESCRG